MNFDMTARQLEDAIDSLRDKVMELRDRIYTLNFELCEARGEHRGEIERLERELAAIREQRAEPVD